MQQQPVTFFLLRTWLGITCWHLNRQLYENAILQLLGNYKKIQESGITTLMHVKMLPHNFVYFPIPF